MCFPFRAGKGQNMNKFDPRTLPPGQSREVVYIYCFFPYPSFPRCFCFLGVFFCEFCWFSKVLRGLWGKKNPWCFRGFPWYLSKRPRKRRTGFVPRTWFTEFSSVRTLEAQCQIPPPIAQDPFEIVSQRGGYRAHLPCFHVVSREYRWDTPFEGRYRTSTLHALPGGNAQKRWGGIAPIWPCWDTKNPMAHNRGVSLR